MQDKINKIMIVKEENKKWFILLAIGLIFAYFTKGITIVFAVASSLMIFFNNKKISKMRLEINEGIKVENVLKVLPKEYTILKNVSFQLDNKSIYIEQLVIGPTGLFVLKTVSEGGEIFGAFNDEIWFNKSEESYFDNPINVVEDDVRGLANYLKENGLQSWVQGIVYFSNENVKLNITDRLTPVFLNNSEENEILLLYIKTYEKEILMDGKKQQIIELFN